MGINAKQWLTLMGPLNPRRISNRDQGGKTLSYVEAWDIKAHLTRIFGFGNWDAEMLEYRHVGNRTYTSQNKGTEMVEVIYSCRMQLRIRDESGNHLCTYSEGAVGSTSGPMSMLGEHHDNALKTAASDALKRCAINLGTQFGLSLYDNGKRSDVIFDTLVKPEGAELPKPEITAEQMANLQNSLGAQEIPNQTESAEAVTGGQ